MAHDAAKVATMVAAAMLRVGLVAVAELGDVNCVVVVGCGRRCCFHCGWQLRLPAVAVGCGRRRCGRLLSPHCRSRAATLPTRQDIHSTFAATMSPQLRRNFAATCLQPRRHVAAPLPQCCRNIAAQPPQCRRNANAKAPRPFRAIAASAARCLTTMEKIH